MSVAQILEEAKSFSIEEIEELEYSLRIQRLQKLGKIALPEESRLLQIINRPLPNWERFVTLTSKWEQEGLSDDERSELLELTLEAEVQNVERAEAILQLSEIKGVSFQTLWERMMGPAPAPLVPRD